MTVSARVARVPSGAAQEVALASDSTNHNTLVAARTQYFSSGKEEWFILYTEGSCAVTPGSRFGESAQSRARSGR
ncbi:unnamed protein product [Effrenium voratum]|nr:unnamed protein product [Effrenium voratum]